MHLIQILLPVYDNNGKPFARAFHRRVEKELTKKFGGLTAYTRSPADGLWCKGKTTMHDDIIVYEVMAEKRNAEWWGKYRVTLEEIFRQEKIIIRAQKVAIL